MRNRNTVTVSTLLVLYKRVKEGHRLEKPEHCDREYILLLDKRVKEGHRLEKPEHCDREYTIIKAHSELLFLRESDRSFGNVVFVSPFFRGVAGLCIHKVRLVPF